MSTVKAAMTVGGILEVLGFVGFIAGVVVWIRQKTPYLFLSGFLMFVFSALGPATGNTDLIFFISMFGELFMGLFLYLYARQVK